MTREQMIDEAVRRSMSHRSMLAVTHRADGDDIPCSRTPFGCMPRRLDAIRNRFRRIVDEQPHA